MTITRQPEKERSDTRSETYLEARKYYRSLLRYKTAMNVEQDIHISLKNRYVYVMVGKAASSTVTYHLQWAEYHGTKFTPQNVNSRYQSPHLAPFQLRRHSFYSIMTNVKFRKFTFVRNPYSRLLSCYLHRIIGTTKMNPSKRVLYRACPTLKKTEISFGNFIDIIVDQETSEMERHWALQYEASLYPLIQYDFVGKQENLQADLLKLEEMIFGKEMFDRDKLTTVNKAPMQTGSSSKIRRYYDDRIAAKVADRYEVDFETFGYSTDLSTLF